MNLAKRLTEIQKEEIIKSFTEGKPIELLSQEFDCTKLTIIRNLKRNLGEKHYKDFILASRSAVNKGSIISFKEIPDMISSILYRVKLILWSVTLPWG